MRDNVESLYYSKQEFDKHEIREERLFKNISSKLEKISSLSNGWNKIFQGINLNEIRSRADLEKIPITRKSDLTFIQSADLPYGGLTIKKPSDFPYMFASPGPIYEPVDEKDFWTLCSSFYSAGIRKKDLVYNTFSYHLVHAGIIFDNAAIHML